MERDQDLVATLSRPDLLHRDHHTLRKERKHMSKMPKMWTLQVSNGLSQLRVEVLDHNPP